MSQKHFGTKLNKMEINIIDREERNSQDDIEKKTQSEKFREQ